MLEIPKTIKLPTEGEKLTFINQKGITPLDVIIQEAKKGTIEKLIILQFNGGKKAYLKLDKYLKEKRIKNIEFFASNFMKSMSPEIYTLIRKINDWYGNTKIKHGDTHAKIIQMIIKDNYYTLISTSNFGSNSKLEMTEVFNNKEIFNFYYNFAQNNFK